MEVVWGQLFILIVLAVFAVLLAYLYRNRDRLVIWLNTPRRYYAEDDVKLRRERNLEDAQKELDSIKK